MPSKCKHPECKSEAGYNFPDKKGRVFCKKHAEPGMVANRVDSRRCIHQSHGDNAPRATFNFPDEKKPLWCKEHSQRWNDKYELIIITNVLSVIKHNPHLV